MLLSCSRASDTCKALTPYSLSHKILTHQRTIATPSRVRAMALVLDGERDEVVQAKARSSIVGGEGSLNDPGSPQSRWT